MGTVDPCDLKTLLRCCESSGHIVQAYRDRYCRRRGVALVPCGIGSGRDLEHLPFVVIRNERVLDML